MARLTGLVVTLATLGALAGPAPGKGGPRARPIDPRPFARTPERVARGRYLVEGVCECLLCHSERDETKPGHPPRADRLGAGRLIREDGPYHLYAPNLTPDPETGAARWPDDALARAIREGVGHDGRALSPPMWWWAFRDLSDEDVASIVVFLRTLPPIRNAVPQRNVPPDREKGILARVNASGPLTAPVPPPDLSTPASRGLYLVKVADCAGCHSAWEAPTNPGLFGGGNIMSRDAKDGRPMVSANITPDPTGIGYYDAALFISAMRTGKVVARELAPAMPWVIFAHMTDEDLTALFTFLRGMRPVRHEVSNIDPPTDCAACGQKHGRGAANKPRVIPRVAVDAALLDDYSGRYRFPDGFTVVVRRDGDKLLAEAKDMPPTELVPTSTIDFEAPALGTAITFVRGKDGRVTSFLSHELEDVVVPRLKK